MMKKIILFVMVLFIVSCGEKKDTSKIVNLYMWGGSQDINRFVDEKLSKEIEIKEGIIINRVPISDIKDTVNKLIVEKKAGRKQGSMDILWVNGENFKNLKAAGVLLKELDTKVENAKLLKSTTLLKDFGESIDGYEIPWGEAQFNFIYDSKNGEQPFSDSKTLEVYISNNKEKFTYPSTTDFTGSAFVRNIAIDILGLETIEKATEEELKSLLTPVWDYFKRIKPNLWREGETYPESEAAIDNLYSKGEVSISMGYTINKVSSKSSKGDFPKSSKSFLLEKGTLFNNHYLAIPENSPNKESAIKVINYLISPEAQLLKQEPSNWGDFTVLDLSKLDEQTVIKFTNLEKDEKIPSMEELKNKRVRELSPSKAKIIDEGWIENIGKN